MAVSGLILILNWYFKNTDFFARKKYNPVRSDILFDFHEYVSSSGAFGPTLHLSLCNATHPVSEAHVPVISSEVVHLKLHYTCWQNTTIHGKMSIQTYPHKSLCQYSIGK